MYYDIRPRRNNIKRWVYLFLSIRVYYKYVRTVINIEINYFRITEVNNKISN